MGKHATIPEIAPIVAPIVEAIIPTLPIVQDDDPRLSDARTPLPHPHLQSDVSGLVAALGAKQETSEKGQANGYASLGADGKVPSGQLPPSGGGTADITQVEVDFGPMAVRSKTFTVTDALVTPSTRIMASQAGDAPTGKNADDNEMDSISFRAVPGTGQFTLYATVIEGIKVGGFYKVNYLKG